MTSICITVKNILTQSLKQLMSAITPTPQPITIDCLIDSLTK